SANAEGPAGSAEPGSAGELGADGRALRDLLHRAVREVEPSDGTLDYLRRAVPARRARKRQALVGMAAAALFVGTAVPAVVHVSTSSGSDANPSAVGHASQAQGGTSQGKGPDNGASTAGGSSDEIEGTGKGGAKGKDEGTGDRTGAGATEGTGPSTSADTGAPACTADHLGAAVASTAAPDSTGTVYGAFRVTNGSGTPARSARRARSAWPRRAPPTRPRSAPCGTRRATRRPDCPTRPWKPPRGCCSSRARPTR